MAIERSSLGVVYTPAWLVQRILQRSLDPLLRGLTARELLRVRVIDPSCGEGAFLIEAGGRLAAALQCARGERGPAPQRRARLQVAKCCLYGVDIDSTAVATARDALQGWALGGNPASSAELRRALERNVVEGDALAAAARAGPAWSRARGRGSERSEVGGTGHRGGEAASGLAKPRVVRSEARQGRGDHGPGEVLRAGGFHVVVGNPPFVEPKRYRRFLPGLEEALRSAGFRTVGAGKVDLALPFLELGAALLRPGGRLGFLIQSRFFRAEYGRAARRWLVENALLEQVEDYGEAPIFRGHATYTAALFLHSGSRTVTLRCFDSLASAQRGRPQHSARLALAALGADPWCFASPSIGALVCELANRHGRLGDHPLRVGVGLQLPLRSLYQLEPLAVERDWLRARNGVGEEVRLEQGAVRPLCRNRAFYPLRTENRDACILFPYAREREGVRELAFDEWEARFPAAADYLRRHRPMLAAATTLPDGKERWHLYRYPKNLLAQSLPKVLFPTTIQETAAAVDEVGDLYVDNVRVLFLRPLESDKGIDLLSIAALLSSTTFSALARQQAGLSENGWRQLNRQYLAAVPFPMESLRKRSESLRSIARQIQARQRAALQAGELLEKEACEQEDLWQRLDELCAEIYRLGRSERVLLEREPRRVSRTELLRRHMARLRPAGWCWPRPASIDAVPGR